MRLERFGLGIAKGLALTFKHLFRPIVTTQYPDQKLQPSRRIRGQQFVWRIDLCTGCATCAKSCPHGIIHIETSRNGDNKYVVDRIEFDTGRCMFCGLCVEVCPFNALYMGQSYEESRYSRRLLWADRETLMSPESKPSAYGHPELEGQIPRQTLLIYGEISKDMIMTDHD
ncbi:MAG: NADH-quinone oxidoreductase subunit I [Dehalococcoidia bacterium]